VYVVPQSQTDKILPRSKSDWIALVRNVVLVVAMGGAAYGGTSAANESRLDRVEAKVERIESTMDRVIDKLERMEGVERR